MPQSARSSTPPRGSGFALPPANVIADAIARKRAEAALAVTRANAEEIRARCSSLGAFAREAWPVLEPATPYKHGWALDAIDVHLKAVSAGEILRLLITVPPGMMKSLRTGVIWPAWEWGPRGMPALRILGSSYRADYATRDNRKMRDLIASDWYQALWGDTVRLASDGESDFRNTATGFRKAVPFYGLTAGRGDRVIIDDPLSVKQAESEADRKTAEFIMREALPSRVNDPLTSAIVVIMQRVHDRDPAAIALEQGYQHLNLPMEYEAGRRCVTYRRDGSVRFADPRTVEGELLFPERFPMGRIGEPGTIANMKAKELTAYAWAGQMQQRPVPRSGGLFQRHWFDIVEAVPAVRAKARGWDMGATEGGGDPTASVLVSEAGGVFYIEAAMHAQLSPGEAERAVLNTAKADGFNVSIHMPQDPGAAGKKDALNFVQKLAGYMITTEPVTGSKEVRAKAAAAQAEFGNVKIVAPRGPNGERPAWVSEFLDELTAFPNGAHDDQVDAFTEAFNALALGGVFTLEHVI